MSGFLSRLIRRGNARASIYEHVRSHVNPDGPGLLEGGAVLPDEPAEANEIRWAPGALDGVAGHHMGIEPDLEGLDRVYGLLEKAANGGASDVRRLDEALRDVDAFAVADPILERLAGSNLHAGAVHGVALTLATKSGYRNSVKFGIVVLGAIQTPDTHDVLATLSRHDEFTLFCGVAIANTSPNPEAALWELAKQVKGWGRVHLVERLRETANPEIQQWILRGGFRNDVMDEYLVHIAATTGRLVEALEVPEPDDEVLEAACDIVSGLIIGGPAESIDDYPDAPRALTLLVGHLQARATRLGQFLALDRMRTYLADDPRSGARTDWPAENQAELLAQVRSILERPEWRDRAVEGLQATDPTSFSEAEQVCRLLQIDTLDAIVERLEQDPSSHQWFNAMDAVDEARLPRVLGIARRALSLDAVATGPGLDLGLGPEFEAHDAVEFIVQGLGRFPGSGWEFIAASLRSPVIRGRNVALNTLEAWPRPAWPPEAEPALRRAFADEPDDEVRARLGAMLGR